MKENHYKHFAPWLRLQKILKAFKELNLKIKNKRILDIGCGYGTLLSKIKEGELYGIDMSSKLLQHANKKIENVIKGDAQKLPFKDHQFDVTISSEVLEHLPDPNKAIEEMVRITKNNGAVIISIPVASWYRILLFKFLKRKPYYLDEDEHLREYSYLSMKRFERISSILANLNSEGLKIEAIEGAYFFSPKLEGMLDYLLRNNFYGLFYLIDRFLGKLPLIKYLGRYLIIKCKLL